MGQCANFFITNQNKSIMLKDQLTSLCAGIILGEVRRDHRLTIISDECGINRKYFTRKYFRLLRFHRQIRLLYALSSWKTREDFEALGAKLFRAIWDFNCKYDDQYYSE